MIDRKETRVVEVFKSAERSIGGFPTGIPGVLPERLSQRGPGVLVVYYPLENLTWKHIPLGRVIEALEGTEVEDEVRQEKPREVDLVCVRRGGQGWVLHTSVWDSMQLAAQFKRNHVPTAEELEAMEIYDVPKTADPNLYKDGLRMVSVMEGRVRSSRLFRE